MITEDYVSFETAKLLKEKGFNELTPLSYSLPYGHESHIPCSNDVDTDFVSRITLQMAMKWLREIHNLVIEPYRTACGYLYTISSIPYGSTKYDNSEAYNGDDEDSGQWTTWEKACENGIEYCLKNLF